MKVKIVTLGCKVNQYESQAILRSLTTHGFSISQHDGDADVVIINSCTVTSASDHKVRQALRRERGKHPACVLVLTGCMPQAFPEKSAELSDADIVLGNKNRSSMIRHIITYFSTKQRIVDITPHEDNDEFENLSLQSFGEKTRAFVKIEDGCNNFCSYCIIPYARGRIRSKKLDAVVAEVSALCASGYKEVVLTGINLSAYGEDIGSSLCEAVEAVCSIPEIERVRLGSLEPDRLSVPIIGRLAKLKKLCPQFHLSLQSGCDETLKRMNRRYTTEFYREMVAGFRENFDNCAISSDVLVGFPGESDREFENTLLFVHEISFAKTHVFTFSKRPGTAACNLPAHNTNRTKLERSRRMIAATRKTQFDFYKSQKGKESPVLFEQEREPGVYAGYTKNYTPVLVKSASQLRGRLLPVDIIDATPDYCIGRLIGEDI